MRTRLPRPLLHLLVGFSFALAAAGEPLDPLAGRGYAVTGGAAPGYVSDRVCAGCHPDLYRSYQEVGMARSFFRPRPERAIEDFAQGPFFHAPSGQYLEMREADGSYRFRRYQLAADGRPIHLLELPVDWVLGSGHHARTYLYRTPSGELYQLPLAWYSQPGRWGMAPGYDRPDHDGVTRRVRRECMFCHNAYPDVAAGSDAYGSKPTYPVELPEGTGCQRCHGPGAEHSRVVLGGHPERGRDTIVNPGRLPPPLRNDVCYECHLQPSVALAGVRRFGRGDYSFRPGEPLAGYLVQMDVIEEGEEPGERFEINHHPYRLEQSRCFVASGGALSCLTCHDPHRKVQPAERPAHYRAACLTCHQVEDCSREAMAGKFGDRKFGDRILISRESSRDSPTPRNEYPVTEFPAEGAADDDCVACHMPQRRTQDVVQVMMTDHRIRRRPGGPELVAPLTERDPVLLGVELYDPHRAPAEPLAGIYRAAAVVQAGGGAAAVDHLAALLAAARPPQIEPYLDLAMGQLRQRRPEVAEATLEDLLRRFPGNPLAAEWLGIVRTQQGRRPEAIALVRQALAADPDRPEALFNLGRLLAAEGRYEEAAEQLERAVALRPNLVAACYHLGLVGQALDRPAEAAASLRRALELDPTHSGAYLALAETLLAQGERTEALRYLRHGATAAKDRAAVTQALAEATAGDDGS